MRNLRPSKAFQDAERISVAAAAAGILVFGALSTSSFIPALYRGMAIISGMEVAFFSSLILQVAYYHGRWILAILGAPLSLFLPCFVNFVWVRFSGLSLIYPVAVVFILVWLAIEMIHRKVSGLQPDQEIEEIVDAYLIQSTDSQLTRMETAMWICVAFGALLKLALMQLR